MASDKMERRAFDTDQIGIEHRQDDNGATTLTGHAAVFNKAADFSFFVEKIAPGAFSEALDRDDVRALWNHDSNFVLGRNKAGTLRLSEDRVGLKVAIDMPDTQFGRDFTKSVQRGDVSQMSFGFIVDSEEWQRGEKNKPDTRVITSVTLFEVSPVTFPAYPQTDISVAKRSHDHWCATVGYPVGLARARLTIG